MIVLLTYFLDCYRENKLISFHIRKLVSLTVVLLQGFPDSSVGKESTCNAGDPSHIPRLGRSAGMEDSIPVFLGFPCGSTGKESTCNAGDLGSIPGLGRYPGEGNGYPLQYSGLENFMDLQSMGLQRVGHD